MAHATATLTAEMVYPEISRTVAAQVDAMLLRLHRAQWGEAACQGRRLVRATLHGDVAARRELRRAEALLTGARY